MKKLGASSILKITVTVILALAALILLAGYAEVDNILRPPRNIPQGKTLRKFNIPYQSVELTTEDGIHLAAWLLGN